MDNVEKYQLLMQTSGRFLEAIAKIAPAESREDMVRKHFRVVCLAKAGEAYHGLVASTPGGPRWTGEIEFFEHILLEPLKWRKPCRVFVNSMSDLFHEKVKDEWLDKAFAVMALTPQHTYQVLTKRPERMREYCDFGHPGNKRIIDIRQASAAYLSFTRDPSEPYSFPLPNVWLGVSVEDQKTFDERWPKLAQTPAAIRWISYEPALSPLDCFYYGGDHGDPISFSQLRGTDATDPDIPGVDWLVVGGESGPNARPFDIQWARDIIAQCKAADVPVFVKQLGAKPEDSTHRDIWGTTGKHHYTRPVGDPLLEQAAAQPGYTITNKQLNRHMQSRKGGDMAEWPEDLRIREFPNG